MTGEVLYRSADLLVRKVGDFGASCCVVTFDSFTDFRTLDRPGFAEAFLRGVGIDAVHVLSRDNDWYQYADIPAAMASVHAATRAYARVVTYGSSMGAYAAIRLAGLAGAGVALALSPQYSIDPTVVRWERRWIENSKLFRNVWERTLAYPTLDECYVVYDPRDDDRHHVALLAQRCQFTKVRVRGAGHPVTGYLAEIGLLQETIVEVCAGRLDEARFVDAAWRRRTDSAQYFLAQAKRTAPWRHGRRIALLREAVRLAPQTPAMAARLGVLLGRAGRFDEALSMHRRSLELAPGHPDMLFNLSVTLEARGDIAGALAAMEQASERSGGALSYRSRCDALRARLACERLPLSQRLLARLRRRFGARSPDAPG